MGNLSNHSPGESHTRRECSLSRVSPHEIVTLALISTEAVVGLSKARSALLAPLALRLAATSVITTAALLHSLERLIHIRTSEITLARVKTLSTWTGTCVVVSQNSVSVTFRTYLAVTFALPGRHIAGSIDLGWEDRQNSVLVLVNIHQTVQLEDDLSPTEKLLAMASQGVIWNPYATLQRSTIDVVSAQLTNCHGRIFMTVHFYERKTPI